MEELDFTEQIKAKHSVSCDNCGKELGEHYPRGADSISLSLRDGDDDYGYPNYASYDFCGEACLRDKLNKRVS
jgi:hypothetical protein